MYADSHVSDQRDPHVAAVFFLLICLNAGSLACAKDKLFLTSDDDGNPSCVQGPAARWQDLKCSQQERSRDSSILWKHLYQ